MEQADIVSNMLRWLLRFSEYEDPPTQDILAGYQLDNRLLHRSLNAALAPWFAVPAPSCSSSSDIMVRCLLP